VLGLIDYCYRASGSIAQVHFATYQGKRTAVKVRHPGVALQLNIDFRIMKSAAALVSQVPGLSWLNLEQSVEAFSHTMTGQTFLDIEANHLALFNEHFKDWGDVFFPQPLVASEAVLVETFENGD
jgi:aarF domain-containing kinase